jgi:5-methylcytosine-specific restriction endonuclease McrA
MPLMPCSEKRARLLLARGRARVHKVVPFVIRLTDRSTEDSEFQLLRLKLDPGSKTTGLALVLDKAGTSVGVLNLFELVHRGRQISEALMQRRRFRHRRRGANLRYRAPRFYNRARQRGWLAPSLRHRVETTMSWVRRVLRWAVVSAISMELVRFDMQALQSQDIAGVEYQQGALFGYEVREYLLEKWGRRCAYCDARDVPLQIEHVLAKARGGSNRVSNLTLGCGPCNLKKGERDVRGFVKDKARLARILAKAKTPLRDAAAVNATRWVLLNALRSTDLNVEIGSGGRTKWNRTRLGLPKTHALDAACVGTVHAIFGWQRPTLELKCSGRGSYQRTRLTGYGFPHGYLTRQKRIHGFQTGDRVRATVPTGKKAGTHVGRVAVRANGNFNIQTPQGVVQGIAHRHCTMMQRADGYAYAIVPLKRGKDQGPAQQQGAYRASCYPSPA